jgi:hypothetical protein
MAEVRYIVKIIKHPEAKGAVLHSRGRTARDRFALRGLAEHTIGLASDSVLDLLAINARKRVPKLALV